MFRREVLPPLEIQRKPPRDRGSMKKGDCDTMKKFLALLLALVMSLSLVACGGGDDTAADGGADAEDGGNAETAAYQVAMITDYGDITDQSFNQTTYEACQEFCDAEGLQFEYYKPAGDSTAERVAMVDAAVADGYNVIVMPGYAFAETIKETAELYPDVTFIALDVAQGDLGEDYTVPSNVYCAVYQEELCGYMAGYAAVKLGYKNLGFLGGMAVPAVIRYGYGFVQGADAAAAELGQNIEINYFYGGQFYGDANITSRMEGWYSNGTQVVFACGGGIYTSAVEAALKNNGYVIGVDVDQNYIGANGVADGTYAYNPFITSAMKGLSEAVNTALADIDAGSWDDIAGSNGNFGLEDGDYIGLPTDADSWNFESFTTDEYEEVKGKIKSGEITVDNSSDDATKPTVSEFTTVNYIQ